jgi:hypothetical protein
MIRAVSNLLLVSLVAATAHAKVAVDLPVITPESVFHGGQALSLQGLSVSPSTSLASRT